MDNPNANHSGEWLQADGPGLLQLVYLEQEKIAKREEELAEVLQEAALRRHALDEEAEQINQNILVVRQQYLNLASATEKYKVDALEDIGQRELVNDELREKDAGAAREIQQYRRVLQVQAEQRQRLEKEEGAILSLFNGAAERVERAAIEVERGNQKKSLGFRRILRKRISKLRSVLSNLSGKPVWL